MSARKSRKPRSKTASSQGRSRADRERSSPWPEELDLVVVHRLIGEIRETEHSSRIHSERQFEVLMASIVRHGFTNPILVGPDDEIYAGSLRHRAAVRLGRKSVPVIRLGHQNRTQLRALRIADNRIAEHGAWDVPTLVREIEELESLDENFEIDDVGFSTSELDSLIENFNEDLSDDPADDAPAPDTANPPVTRLGDLFQCGRHRILCADARDEGAYPVLLGDAVAELIFTDPPFNVRIDGHASGLGRIRHREFAMASGEMTSDQFVGFLQTIIKNLIAVSADGSIHFICHDWRHIGDLLRAAEPQYSELKNVCVWAKTNGGMGSFYRSQHELIFAFKNGTAPHINNFSLGQGGRYRTNVWSYAGANTFRRGREDDLAWHPTVKPVALVADALKDCSRRNGVILDAFGCSGTTFMAAEKTRRRAHLLEIDPVYVDVTVRRWEALTGQRAVHAETRLTFQELALQRRSDAEEQPARARRRRRGGADGG